MNVDELKEKLLEANRTYRTGNPIMSDQVFDDMLEMYESMVSDDEYSEFRNSLHEVKGKVKHPYVMGSLNKVKIEEPDAIKKFISSHITTCLNVSAKVDGISCRLHYEDGKLVSASTRGDGSFGEDLTNKIGYVKCIPQTISNTETIDIRGELVILKDDFAEMTGFANPRNACAGIMNRKDFDPNDISKVSFIAYTILGSRYPKDEQFSLLKNYGFVTSWNNNFTSYFYLKDDVVDQLFQLASQTFDYETDGLVVCDSTYKNETEYRPDACVAVKTNQLIAETRLLDIEWSGPSKDGFFTPIALIEPVELGGATISRATLHNLNFISDMGLMYGSKIGIVKSGDIIPKVVKLIENDANCAEIEYPTTCSCCGSTLVRDGINYRCTNRDCEDQNIIKVCHFIKKLGVKSASEKTLANFKIFRYEDLLKFKANPKYKSQIKLETELNDKMFSKSKIDIFCSLDMMDVGEVLLHKIVDHYGWDLIERSVNDVSLIKKHSLPSGIGEITFEKFIEGYLDNIKFTNMVISDARYHYSETAQSNSESARTNKNGMSVCFTGKLNTMSRSDASKMAENAGFDVLGGVNRKLTYLVTNDSDSGSSKNKKAKELGVKVISETEFLRLISSNTIETDISDL